MLGWPKCVQKEHRGKTEMGVLEVTPGVKESEEG